MKNESVFFETIHRPPCYCERKDKPFGEGFGLVGAPNPKRPSRGFGGRSTDRTAAAATGGGGPEAAEVVKTLGGPTEKPGHRIAGGWRAQARDSSHMSLGENLMG